jgi:TonB family protein
MTLKWWFSIVAGAILLVSLGAGPLCSDPSKTRQYVPPNITAAGDITYPVNTLAAGAVSLLLNLDSTGQVQTMQVLRDFPSLTTSAENAVQSWSFSPAILNGSPVSSNISVTIVYNLFNPAGGATSQSLVLSPPQTLVPDASHFTPPQITLASFAKYPANSVSQGTVVLDVTVGTGGEPRQVRVIRGVPTLTQQAVSAVKTWQCNAGMIKEQPVRAEIIVAFVFQRDMS